RRPAEQLALGLDLDEQVQAPSDEGLDGGDVLEQLVAGDDHSRDLLHRLVRGREAKRGLWLRAALGNAGGAACGRALVDEPDGVRTGHARAEQALDRERLEQLL